MIRDLRLVITSVLIILLLVNCSHNAGSTDLTRQETNEGWQLLSDDLSKWILKPGTWTLENGVLEAQGDGDIWSKAAYGNFVLSLEFKIIPKSNSGVFIRTGSIENWLHTAIEVQVLDSYGKPDPGKHDCGAIYDVLAPSKNMVREPGEWNKYIITCIDNEIMVNLNGEDIIDMNLNRWTTAHSNPDGTKNKFNTAYKDMPRTGKIGLQYHGDPVWYRNIKVKEL